MLSIKLTNSNFKF